MILTKFFKGMKPHHITQGFNGNHQALDIVGSYGTPLCAPENCLVLGIRGDSFTPDNTSNLKYGYGIRLKGLETGKEYLFWHCLPYFPVWGGDTVKRGSIVAFMGNSGYVLVGGKEVRVDERLSPGKPGSHLHIEMFEDRNGEELKVNPLPIINWSWEPQWTKTDFIKAIMVCLSKMLRAVK